MPVDRADEDYRRAYWSEQMNKAYDFMAQVTDYAVEECGEPLVSLETVVAEEEIVVEFSRRKLPGGLDRLFYLRQGLIGDFLSLARSMNQRGWVLKVEDGYRTKEIQSRLARCPAVFDKILVTILWECNQEVPNEESMLRRLSVLVAQSPKTGTHMAGTAIDVSVLNKSDGQEIDRGGPYLTFSEITPLGTPFVSPEAQKNRGEISALMQQHGFVAYPYEFWHYSKDDAYDEMLHGTGRPARYGPVQWDSKSNTVSPIENPARGINSLEQIKHEIKQAFERLKSSCP